MHNTPKNDFDGRVLNPRGVEIILPFWAFRRLKKLNLLERNLETGERRISTRVFELMEIWEEPEFRSDRRLRALDPVCERSQSKDSGYANSFLKVLGRDCSGLA